MSSLDDLRKRLRSAASGSLKARLLQAASAEALAQVQLGFREQRAPSGEPWAPLKHRNGMILRDTARMANSFTSRVTDSGFAIGTNVEYAPFHQYGTSGRKQAATRQQKISKRGRFSKKGKRTRTLAFKAGSGVIPARPMVPVGGLPTIWRDAIQRAVETAFRKFWR